MNRKVRSAVLAGGGTAGHVNPLLSTAKMIRNLDPEVKISVVGTHAGLETELVPKAGFDLSCISRVPFPRRVNGEAFLFPYRFAKAVREAGKLLDSADADVVLGFGGYVSTPIYLAAAKRKIRIVVHEGNAMPGLANKVGARFADVVALTFASTPLAAKKGRTVTLGLPLRPQILRLTCQSAAKEMREEALRHFSLSPDRPVLLVTGGSLGAAHLNEVFARCAQEIIAAGIQVLHLTGKGKRQETERILADTPRRYYRVVEYLNSMEQAYAVADLAVTRAGAGMVCELAALAIPAVFVPLPVGNGEQALNARDAVSAGAALMCPDCEFDADFVRTRVLPLFASGSPEGMKAAARKTGMPDAGRKLAETVLGR